MISKRNERWIDYAILGLTVFLVFCLAFDSFMALPKWVSWLGHWHPVVLHFPIVLLLICVVFGIMGKTIPRPLLLIAVFSALLTAISGFFLGKETEEKGTMLLWHQWLGGGVALLSVGWYVMFKNQKKLRLSPKVPLIGFALLIVITAHYGGMLTHGENFLALPANETGRQLPEDPLVYGDVVHYILEDKCVSCHNENKQKGELVMTDLSMLFKGGKSDSTVLPGNPEESELIQRLHLPLEEEEHMPPEGKLQLTDTEIKILERWIALGASDTLKLSGIKEPEPLIALLRGLLDKPESDRWKDFPKVEDSTLQRLATDYLSLGRIAANSNAITVDMYLPPQYDPNVLFNLKKIAPNVVELDISGIPLQGEEIDWIATCLNIEVLELDNTPITDLELDKLKVLRKLRLLKAFNTSITDKSISFFESLPDLKQIFLWDTEISESKLESLRQKRPDLEINTGLKVPTKVEDEEVSEL